MGVSIKDIVELAKAGYTPAQVKELISLSEKAEPAKPDEPQESAAAPIEPKTAIPEPEETKAPEKEAKQEAPEKTVDYKELYEKTVAELKAAQEANRTSSQPEDDPEKEMNDLKAVFASYM